MRSRERRARPFWYLRRRSEAVLADVDEELAGHIDRRVEYLRARGVPPGEARVQALCEFGDLEETRRYCGRQGQEKERRMRASLWAGDVRQDFRIGVRGLLRARALAATIVVTVGLGIGATTAIFAVVDAALLRPLPYPEADRLVRIYTDAPPNKFRFSVADYLALEAQQTTFAQVAGYTERAMAFTDGRTAERLRGRLVSWSYFELLGITPVIGRRFTATDGKPGSPPVVIVSTDFWRQRLGGRADAVGAPVRLDGTDYAVAGVLPPVVGPLEQGQEFFIAAQWDTPKRKGPFFILALGRLPGATAWSAAAAELHAISKRLFPLWRASYQDEKATWALMDMKAAVVGNFAAMGGLALAAVLLVWLIACVNAANLLVARVTSRRRELAVRTALGASRRRVVMHLLAESAILAISAAIVGATLAWLGIGLVRTAGAAFVPRTAELALTGRALSVLAGVTFASALLFGLVPAIHGTGGAVDEGLRSLGRSSTGSAAVRRLRSVLIGSQFAVATPLLIVAGLLIGSLNQLRHVDLGFDSHNILTGGILLPPTLYRDSAQVIVFWSELRRRVAALPGVTAVAFTDSRPPEDAGNQNNFDLEAAPTPPEQSQPVTTWVAVTPEYFSLLGMRLVQGRLLNGDDNGDGPPVIVVDQAWASRFFPGQSAVGKRLQSGGCTTCPLTTIVGIVSNVMYDGLDRGNQGTVYTPIPERGTSAGSSRSRYLVLRTGTDPAAVLPAVRQTIRAIDSSLPFSRVATIDDLVAGALQTPRALSLLVGALALVAIILSAVGIYGVMAHYVQQHAKDISIRLALGGRPLSVLRLIVGRGMRLVSLGVLAGAAIAAVFARLMGSLLFGVGPADPFTFTAVTAAMLTTAALACWVPAARAIAMEPASVLRHE